MRQHLPEHFSHFTSEEVTRVETEYAGHRHDFARADGDLRGSWCSVDLGARAAKTGFAEVYRLVNPISSQLIHGTFGGLVRHFDLGEDEHRIAVGPSMRYCGEALSGGHACTLQMVQTLANTFGWEPCIAVTMLEEDFRRAWRRNGA